jgi:hypothetical protein
VPRARRLVAVECWHPPHICRYLRGRPVAMRPEADLQTRHSERPPPTDPESRGAADQPNGRASARPPLSHPYTVLPPGGMCHGFQI